MRIAHVYGIGLCAAFSLFAGSAALAQDVTLSPTTLSWGAVQVGQLSAAKSVTVTNTQAVPLTISSISVPAGADFLVSSTTCPLSPSTLAAAGTCTVSVQFRPLATGSRTSAVKLTDDAPSATQSLPLSGNGSVGTVLYSPTSLSFSNVAVGTTSPAQSVTLTNMSAAAITLTAIKISAGAFSQTNNCPLTPSTLAAGASCTFNVTYAPIAPGSSSGTVTVTDSTGTVTASTQLYLSGSTAVTNVTLTPASKDFGSVLVGTPSSVQAFTLTNTYTQAVTISSIATTLTDFAATSPDCPVSPATLAPGGTCTVNVTFTPSATGARPDTLTVSHDAPGLPATASLTGTGTAPVGGITIAPTSLSWATVQIGMTSGAKSVTLTNNSSAALAIATIAVGSDFNVNSTTCPLAPSTLAIGSSCTISVSFRPLAQGVRSDMITVTDDGPASPQLVPLSGTGVVGSALFSPTSLTFPSTAVGSSAATQTATLTNQLSTALNIGAITVSGNYSQTNNCPASLAANASCTFTVGFTPTTSGTKNGMLSVNYGTGTLSLFLSGTATGGTGGGGNVSYSPKIFTYPNQALGAASAPLNVTLTNNQTTALNISGIQVASPFSQSNNCGSSLAAGKSCTITVTFSPTVVGFFSSSLVITDDAAGSPRTIALSGNGVVPVATLPVMGGLYFYNQIVQTPSTPLPVTLTNNLSVALSITSMTTSVDFPFTTDCVGTNGTGSLAPGATCTVQITFIPQAVGDRSASLTVAESAVGSPLVVPLQGLGIAGDQGPTVNVGPYNPCMLPSAVQQFSSFVTGISNTAVNWFVDNHQGGNAAVGTITAGGLYTAPATTGTHIIKAVSQSSSSVAGTSVATITATPVFGIYPYVASIPPNGQTTFQAQVCAVPDTGSVTFSVDNIPGGNATVGTVTSGGVYTAPAVAGKHTVRATDLTLNKTSGGVVTVFANIAADFDSRTNTLYPVPANMFGAGRGEAMHSDADRSLLTQAGLTVSRLYAQIPLVYKTQTPDWTQIDPMITSIRNTGQHPIMQLSLTPPWLQPSPNPCGAGSQIVVPTDINKWAQIAASYVQHMDANFPGFVQDYEIWNEPNSAGMCANNHMASYMAIYAAAAPAMKAQAALDGQTIRIGGPVLSSYSQIWLSTLLTTPSTAPYVDFVSYHQYLFGSTALQVQWDGYNGNSSMYQAEQDPNFGAAGLYNKVLGQVKLGSQPLGANTPIYVTEFNTNWSFFKDCCRNDPAYAPVFNSLYLTYMLNTVYNGSVSVPNKLIYFASSAYPWFCVVGVQDPNMDCLYSAGATPTPYPQFYAFQLIAGSGYLGLSGGGYMAKTVTPPAGGGGIAATAFYTPTLDAIVITNPTATSYSNITVSFQNAGFPAAQGTLYQIVNGAMINSSSVSLTSQGAGYTTTISIPPYSVQAVSVKAQ